jgi:hypothetical protein
MKLRNADCGMRNDLRRARIDLQSAIRNPQSAIA